MEYIKALVDNWQWLITLGGIITALYVLWNKAISPLLKFIKRAKKIINDIEKGYPILEQIVNDFSEDGKCDLADRFKILNNAIAFEKEKYKIYLELEDDAIFETDKDGKYIWVSERWTELFGQNSIEAANHGWLAGVSSLDRDRVFHEWAIAISQSRQFKMKFRVRENGKARWVNCLALPLKNDKNEFLGYIGKINEINPSEISEEINNALK